MNKPIGIILAGGQSMRLQGQDKGLLIIDGKPLVAHTIERLANQVKQIVISANRNIESYRRLGYPVIEDAFPGFQGPLAGIASVMNHLAENEGHYRDYGFVAACDMPFLPVDFVERVRQQQSPPNKTVYVAHDGSRPQNLCALIPFSLRDDLNTYLAAGNHQVHRWLMSHEPIFIDYSDMPEAFANLNSGDDLKKLLDRHAQ